MTPVIDVLEKIHSDKLRHQAEVRAVMPQTVMVEVKLPQPTVVRSGRNALTPGRPAMRIEAEPAGNSDAVVEKTRRLISEIVGEIPQRYLSSSHAFVLDATGAQLRALAEIPSIQAIWPNTRHR